LFIFAATTNLSISVVKDFLTTAKDGKNYTIKYYNLDVIISVGYRVKSKQGTQFRIWATNVLRDYLLKGYALNQRMDRIENNYENLSNEVKQISLQIKTNLPPNQGVFFNGQVFDAYIFFTEIIKNARKSIVDSQLSIVKILSAKRLYGSGIQLFIYYERLKISQDYRP
jgi:hypothetical protein